AEAVDHRTLIVAEIAPIARFGRIPTHIYFRPPSCTVQDCLSQVGPCIIAGLMPKSRARRRTNASGGISRDGTRQQSSAPARRDAGPQRPLLDRILDTPHLAQVVPRL